MLRVCGQLKTPQTKTEELSSKPSIVARINKGRFTNIAALCKSILRWITRNAPGFFPLQRGLCCFPSLTTKKPIQSLLADEVSVLSANNSEAFLQVRSPDTRISKGLTLADQFAFPCRT